MPVPTHFRFVVRGIFVGTPESWSFGMHFSRDNPAEPDAGTDDINEGNVTAALVTFFQSNLISNDVEVKDWRFYVIGTDGLMVGNAPLLHLFAPAELKGVNAGTKHPPQVALAVTTVATERGAAKRGRFYIPGPNKPVGTDWRLSAADAIEYQVAAVNLMKGVADSIDMELLTSSNGVNVSKGPVGSATGTKQSIDHIEVGRVYDTVTNRRKSLVEDRQASGHIDW